MKTIPLAVLNWERKYLLGFVEPTAHQRRKLRAIRKELARRRAKKVSG